MYPNMQKSKKSNEKPKEKNVESVCKLMNKWKVSMCID